MSFLSFFLFTKPENRRTEKVQLRGLIPVRMGRMWERV
jgi:hypothetical protein